jgi:hypothetical protein
MNLKSTGQKVIKLGQYVKNKVHYVTVMIACEGNQGSRKKHKAVIQSVRAENIAFGSEKAFKAFKKSLSS